MAARTANAVRFPHMNRSSLAAALAAALLFGPVAASHADDEPTRELAAVLPPDCGRGHRRGFARGLGRRIGVPAPAMLDALQAFATSIDLDRRDPRPATASMSATSGPSSPRACRSVPVACCGRSCRPPPRAPLPSIASARATAPSISGWRTARRRRRPRSACRSTSFPSPRASACAPIRSTSRRRRRPPASRAPWAGRCARRRRCRPA